MDGEAEFIVLARRLKRQLTLWRGLAVLAVVALVAVAVGRLGGGPGGSHVARLEVAGVITDDVERDRAIASLARNSRARALLVRIDSPGGTVAGGEALFQSLRALAGAKPVVAVMGEMATSAGYMAALAADHIVAREGTLTGSIGVILQTTDVTGLLGKLGISTEAIKSAPLKAVPSPLEPLTEAGREASRAIVLDVYNMFVAMLADRRGLSRERAAALSDGRVFTGRQAIGLGLVDALGGEDEARAWLAAERGVPADLPMRPLKIEREAGWWRELIAALSGKMFYPETLTLDGLVSLWHPGLQSR